ncbi:unnamed protein product [Sympodiomycopsis kandeliae]
MRASIISATLLSMLSLCSLVSAASSPKFSNPIYLIRHGEKPADGGDGLSAQGENRAQCLRDVFGASSGYDIGFIITQDYKSSGKRIRPYETVKPLADDLGLTIDHHCDRDDSDCAVDTIQSFTKKSNKAILLCWEHDALSDISKGLGDKFDYPDDSFNLIYEILNGKLTGNSPLNEHCPGLDS